MSVEFRILGPLQALVDGKPASLGGRQQRTVLAILLAQANQTVPVDRLIDDVWDDSPPETAANLLQGYVSQLRKALGKEAIATRGRGYAVVVPSGDLDLNRFEQRAEAGMAERSTGSAEKASAELTAASLSGAGPLSRTWPIFPGSHRSPPGSMHCVSPLWSTASRPTWIAAAKARSRPSSTP